MIIVHAGLVEDQIVLWAESSVGVKKAARRAARTADHPFALDWRQLAKEINAAVPLLSFAKEAATVIPLWLPANGSQPVPSSPLLSDEAELCGQADSIALFTVPGLHLHPGELRELLRKADSHRRLTSGVLLGAEFDFLAQASRLAASLVVRQQYLPTVTKDGERYLARWKPIFQREDISRVNSLTAALPGVLRGTDDGSAKSEPASAEPLYVVKGLLATLVDDLVRDGTQNPIDQNHLHSRHHKHGQHRPNDNVHDCWLAALSGSQCQMDFDGHELEKFDTQVRDWTKPIIALHEAPFRLCFRLAEPARMRLQEQDSMSESLAQTASDCWKVDYLLQDKIDQSLLIPAKEAWNNNALRQGKASAVGARPREHLLLALSQASRLCPEVGDSLNQPSPGGFDLDTNSAYQFLFDKAQALEQAGFGVMLPSWWKKGDTRARLKLTAAAKSSTLKVKGQLTLDKVVQFDWQAALGDVPVSLKELRALADLKAPLVNVRGQWIHVSSEEIQSAIAFLTKKASATTTVRDVIKLALGASNPVEGGAPVVVQAEGWIHDLLSQLEEPYKIEELSQPQGFDGSLRPYQARGYSWLSFLERWGLGACLADDMGLGKTVQTLAMIQKSRVGGETRPVLLVCPTSVLNNWVKEAARFTPSLSVLVHHGGTRIKSQEFLCAASKHAIVLSSYALLHRDIAQLKQVEWAGVILDEAQNIKNAETKQSLAARQLPSRYRVALTGTPVENSVGDLWSIMDFLNPGLLGTQTTFRKNFFYPIQVERDQEVMQRLKRITQPFMLRRLKTDKTIIDDLPDKQEMNIYCSLTKEQATLYGAVLKDLDAKLKSAEGIERKGLVLATLLKLKQVCNHPAHFLSDNSALPGRSGKLQRLEETLDEILQAKERVLIFTQFVEMGELIKQHLEETWAEEVLFLHGGIARPKRDAMVQRFQSPDGPSIFLLSLKAGGVGLNLTAANHVIHYDRWWNPAVENQASDRAFRIGQTKQVQVRKFICAGTMEEKINAMIEAKQELAQNIVGTGEGWLTELSNEELRQVFALSKEALVD